MSQVQAPFGSLILSVGEDTRFIISLEHDMFRQKMLQALMVEQLVFLPKSISLAALLVLIVAGTAEIRQGHIGRPGIVANGFLLWQIFFSSWNILPYWFSITPRHWHKSGNHCRDFLSRERIIADGILPSSLFPLWVSLSYYISCCSIHSWYSCDLKICSDFSSSPFDSLILDFPLTPSQ